MTKTGLIFLAFTCADLLLSAIAESFDDMKDGTPRGGGEQKAAYGNISDTTDENNVVPVSLQTAVHAVPIFYF